MRGVTAQCFNYGHAIGHAAAISALENMAPAWIELMFPMLPGMGAGHSEA